MIFNRGCLSSHTVLTWYFSDQGSVFSSHYGRESSYPGYIYSSFSSLIRIPVEPVEQQREGENGEAGREKIPMASKASYAS